MDILTEAMTEEAAGAALNNNMGMGGFLFTVIIYLLVLGLVIGGFIYFRRYINNRANRVTGIKGGANGAGMRIRDRLVIAQDKQIILLEVGGRILMIGISAQSMSALGEFEKDELYDESDDALIADESKSFLGILGEKIRTGFDNFDKNKKN